MAHPVVDPPPPRRKIQKKENSLGIWGCTCARIVGLFFRDSSGTDWLLHTPPQSRRWKLKIDVAHAFWFSSADGTPTTPTSSDLPRCSRCWLPAGLLATLKRCDVVLYYTPCYRTPGRKPPSRILLLTQHLRRGAGLTRTALVTRHNQHGLSVFSEGVRAFRCSPAHPVSCCSVLIAQSPLPQVAAIRPGGNIVFVEGWAEPSSWRLQLSIQPALLEFLWRAARSKSVPRGNHGQDCAHTRISLNLARCFRTVVDFGNKVYGSGRL